jgi:hypothetical protein
MIVDHRKWCGGGHLLLDSSTLVPLTATFKAGGFPQTFDNACVIAHDAGDGRKQLAQVIGQCAGCLSRP